VGGLFLEFSQTISMYNRKAISGDQVGISSPKLHRPPGESYTSPSPFPHIVQPERERGKQVGERVNRWKKRKSQP
jgi:hypothetical protein